MDNSEEKRLFQESIENARKNVNFELYSRQDIEDKIKIYIKTILQSLSVYVH